MSDSYLVFTDLDGTLLDHDTYSFAPAAEAMRLLAAREIPWVFNTSKTRAELAVLREQLGNPHPFIVENGAAVFFPEGCGRNDIALEWVDGMRCKRFAPERGDILALLARWREVYGFRFRGFADMTAQELSEVCGLHQNEASLALDRHFSEPILWQDSDDNWQRFAEGLANSGLQALKGGRFIHIMGAADKGAAMQWLAAVLDPEGEALTVALGDSHNDVAMLQAADIAVVVRSPHHVPPVIKSPSGEVIITEGYGPSGWNEALRAILSP
ncbi:HAD-IIB family hydrolase [Spongiibacter sp. KMU-166]|uniref:HAD-IIB family hydrolase n=1 Tax=Spongiibacter thalassae TaxID=2721624 RepID=A0ABX1GI02_9GAMM|nr:HAD-IIB family hydrolase [Spongiibacter thalassae]